MLRRTGFCVGVAALCLLLGRAGPALPAPSAMSLGPPNWAANVFDLGDVSATWSAKVVERDCLADGTCFNSPVGGETDTYRATWPGGAYDGGFSFDAGEGVQQHDAVCRDEVGGTTGKRPFPSGKGTLSMKLTGAQAGVHLVTGWDCSVVQGAFDDIGVTPSTFDAADLVAPSSLQRSSLSFSYTGSRRYTGVKDGTTVTIDTQWKVAVRYVTSCQGLSVEQSGTRPARFVRSWGRAPFCIQFDSRGLPDAGAENSARSCEAQVAKAGTFTCRAGPKLTPRSLDVCALMSTAEQQRLQGSQGRSKAPQSYDCVFAGANPQGLLEVRRFVSRPWPDSVANEIAFARRLSSMGLATFKIFTTPGGGKAVVVRGSRLWETWAVGEKHGEVLVLTAYAPGNPYLGQLGARLDAIVRTMLGRF